MIIGKPLCSILRQSWIFFTDSTTFKQTTFEHMIVSALINLLQWGTCSRTIGICLPLTALSYKLLLNKEADKFEHPVANAIGTKILTD